MFKVEKATILIKSKKRKVQNKKGKPLKMLGGIYPKMISLYTKLFSHWRNRKMMSASGPHQSAGSTWCAH